MIDKNTKLYFSVSSKPGNFGATFFNTAFQHLDINAIYKPLQYNDVDTFDDFLCAVADSNLCSGMAVSMPFKKLAHKWCKYQLVDVNPHAISTQNINTITFGKKTKGWNLDATAFERACRFFLEQSGTALVYGKGAVSDSICDVLERWYNIKTERIGRGEEFYFKTNFGRPKEFLINASPVGMDGVEDAIFNLENTSGWKYVFDVVGKHSTNLLECAKATGAKTISGTKMQFEGACEQFRLYTGIRPPQSIKLMMQNRGYMI